MVQKLFNFKILTMDEEKNKCDWKKVDFGLMGCHDYEYVTSCNKQYDCDSIDNNNNKYCLNCGGKINLIKNTTNINKN